VAVDNGKRCRRYKLHFGIPTFHIGFKIYLKSGFIDQQIVEKRGFVSIFQGLM